MDKQERAYKNLLRGIQQFVKEAVNKYADKTYVGLVKAYDSIDDEYTVELNGIEYSHVSTIGGSCSINETVHILIPQGNFTNMVIMKGGTNGEIVGGVSSVNGYTGDVTLGATDVSAVSSDDIEDTDIDFTNYFNG